MVSAEPLSITLSYPIWMNGVSSVPASFLASLGPLLWTGVWKHMATWSPCQHGLWLWYGSYRVLHVPFRAMANAIAVCRHPPIDLSDRTATAWTSKEYGEALTP